MAQHLEEDTGIRPHVGVQDESAIPALERLAEELDIEFPDADALLRDRSSWSPSGAPLAVISARTASEVERTLRFASAHGIPVATRTAGSGLAGGSAADSGWLVLDVSALDRVLDIDPVNQLAIVEPGVSAQRLNEAVAEYGLRYAPDPASIGISSIGGNIATNAGGFRAVKYGVTRGAVRALTVITGDGRTLRTGTDTVKGVVGYDLVSLITGSEGTLGVIVNATVALQPIPQQTVTQAAFFTDIRAAAAAAAAILASSATPSLCELIDAATLRAIDAATGSTYSTKGDAFLLVQTDGWGAQAEADHIATILAPVASLVEVADSADEAQRLIETRRLALPSLERLGRLLIEDIAVPISALAEAVERIEQISRAHQVAIFTIGHAGDGNLHPIILVPEAEDAREQSAWEQRAADAADETFALALELGGTVSAEHGVGVLKRDWSREELGAVALDLHAGIKQVFDPAGILNPGKGF